MSLVDVAPTLLSLLGLPRDERMQSFDVSTHLYGEPLAPRQIGAGLRVALIDIEALVPDRFELIRSRRRLGDPDWVERRLFDLVQDPAESRDLAETLPDLLYSLNAKIDLKLAAQIGVHEQLLGGHSPAPHRLDATLRRRLDELGYAGR